MWSTGSVSARTNVAGCKCQCVTHTSLRESSWATTVHCFISASQHRGVFLGNRYIEQDMEKSILTFYLTSAIVPWGLTWSWSSAMQSIKLCGTNTPSGFWHHSLPLRKSPSQTLMLPLLKMRVLRWAQDSSTSPAPGHVFVTLYSSFASSLFNIYDFPGPHQKKKSSCFLPPWLYAVNFLLQLAPFPVSHH